MEPIIAIFKEGTSFVDACLYFLQIEKNQKLQRDITSRNDAFSFSKALECLQKVISCQKQDRHLIVTAYNNFSQSVQDHLDIYDKAHGFDLQFFRERITNKSRFDNDLESDVKYNSIIKERDILEMSYLGKAMCEYHMAEWSSSLKSLDLLLGTWIDFWLAFLEFMLSNECCMNLSQSSGLTLALSTDVVKKAIYYFVVFQIDDYVKYFKIMNMISYERNLSLEDFPIRKKSISLVNTIHNGSKRYSNCDLNNIMTGKEYVIGIDFGNYTTAAWILPIIYNGKSLEPDGTALMISNANDIDSRIIYSGVHKREDGTYSLGIDCDITGLKTRISTLTKEKREAYAAFIRLVVEKILENNKDLLRRDPDTGVYNFELCIATPTHWSNTDKQEYLNFVNDSLHSLGIQVAWMTDECLAINSNLGHVNNKNDIGLIIDYKADRIDYAVIQNNEAISDDDWSNPQLGASNIEHLIINHYKDTCYDEYERCLNGQLEALHASGIGHISEQQLMNVLLFEARMAKERSFDFCLYPKLHTLYFNYRVYLPPKYKSYFKGYTMEIDCNLADIIGDGKESKDGFKPNSNYVLAVEQDWIVLKKKIIEQTGRNVDYIILSGGACRMNWVAPLAKKVFQIDTVVSDLHPSYDVAKGIALCRKMILKGMPR